MIELHPLYGDDPTRNGDFGYFLPERKLGNYELGEFFKLARIPVRYAQWYTRSGIGGNMVQPDWCWQNYGAGFGYGVDSGRVFLNSICSFLEMNPDDVFVSYQYGRSSMQFTFTEIVEERILNLLKEAGKL